MVRERLKLTQDDLEKTKKLLEKALRDKTQLDQKLGKSQEELMQFTKKVSVQEKVLARGESQYKVSFKLVLSAQCLAVSS